jgi:hypothetical protein
MGVGKLLGTELRQGDLSGQVKWFQLRCAYSALGGIHYAAISRDQTLQLIFRAHPEILLGQGQDIIQLKVGWSVSHRNSSR